jgi:hypothetical protein
MCIHSQEAAWTSHDSGHNGHYGGLQMRFAFMRGYAPELFTPVERMWVAERAPHTRMCGLLR